MLPIYNVLAGLGICGFIVFSSLPYVSVSSESFAPVDPDYCTANHKGDQNGCLADHEHNCVWCISKAVKPACYNAEVAKQLPHSVFNCSTPSLDAQLLTE